MHAADPRLCNRSYKLRGGRMGAAVSVDVPSPAEPSLGFSLSPSSVRHSILVSEPGFAPAL